MPRARRFGEAGSYLRIRGVAKGELDPAAPENQVIVDLDKAPRNARGLVEYETDFFILRPADPSRTNGVLVYDVTNRGRKRILATARRCLGGFAGRGERSEDRARTPGSAFRWAAATASSGPAGTRARPPPITVSTARFPTAIENGRPVTGRIRHEFHIGTRAPGKGDIVRLPYPAVSTDKQQARLTVRDRESDTRTEIPADSWEFADRPVDPAVAAGQPVRAVQDL